MIVIRAAQLAALQAAMDARGVERLCAEVRAAEPEAVEAFDDEALRANMAVALARARGHGMVSPLGVTEFFMVMLRHGPRFDEVPALREFLTDARIHALWREAPGQALAEASALPAPDWWRTAS
jgi:hypothetical protein